MEVIVVDEAGFCFGVKRAIKLAFEAARREKNYVYTLGPIIHNPQVCQSLSEQGVKVANSLSDVKSGVVILRSHGVPPNVYQEIKEAKLKIVDAVCPIVKKVQELACKLKDEGWTVIIIGEKNHPEVNSIAGTIEGETLVVEGQEDAKRLKLIKKIGVLAQTTQSFTNFQETVKILLTKTKELKIYNTICNVVETRQKKSLKIASLVDVMLIVGGRNSANTTRLFYLCLQMNPHVYHIETKLEINYDWLKGKKKVGVTSGTSTPPWLIKEIVEELQQYNSL